MRILNQKGDRSIEMSAYDIVRDENRIYAENSGRTRFLGEYETEERAIELFDSLHEKYLDCVGTLKMPKN